MSEEVCFFSEGIDFELSNQDQIANWIRTIATNYNAAISELNYIFVSDERLGEMNQEHLNHDTLTDIITFPLHEQGPAIVSDIYISVDRVRENAVKFNVAFEDELHRVMIHGFLHMAGEDDKDVEAKEAMRKGEDFALSLRDF